MSLQICPNCKQLGCTWYTTDEERTFWHCSECDFEIEEDEKRECICLNCGDSLPSASWLFSDTEEYYWCFTCNERTTNTQSFDWDNFLKNAKRHFRNTSSDDKSLQ